jgi:DNA-directed RNA polymerase specialized sigma subunit
MCIRDRCGTITAGKRAIHLSRIHKTISDAPWCRRGIRNRRNTEVNRDLLEQYTDAVKLIKETRETIKKLEKRNSVQTKDTVSGSNSEFPFQPMHFVIQGKTHDEDDKIERQKRRQQIQIEQAEKLKNDVEEWMLTIPFRMRRIIKFKIFEEMNWQQVAKHIGGKATGESVRKEFETFMKK